MKWLQALIERRREKHLVNRAFSKIWANQQIARAISLRELGRVGEAIDLLHHTLARAPEYGPGVSVLACSLIQAGRLPEAEHVLKEALAHFANDPTAPLVEFRANLGEIAAKRRKLPEAIQWFKEATATPLSGNVGDDVERAVYGPMLLRLAELLTEDCQFEAAVHWARRALEFQPDDQRTRRAFGIAVVALAIEPGRYEADLPSQIAGEDLIRAGELLGAFADRDPSDYQACSTAAIAHSLVYWRWMSGVGSESEAAKCAAIENRLVERLRATSANSEQARIAVQLWGRTVAMACQVQMNRRGGESVEVVFAGFGKDGSIHLQFARRGVQPR